MHKLEKPMRSRFTRVIECVESYSVRALVYLRSSSNRVVVETVILS